MKASLSKKRWAVAIAGVAAIGAVAAVALAEPGSGVTSENFVTANLDHTVHVNSDRIKFQTKDQTDVRVQKLVFGLNSRSGWHHHPGIVIVTVESGAVTLWQSDCSSTTYGPGLPDGNVFVEGGDDPVQATSTNGAVNYVTLIAPNANPPVFRIEDDPISCP